VENIDLGPLGAEMNRGFLHLLVLAVLEKPTYGYLMLKSFERLGYSVEEPTLYPLLRRLESRGLIRSEWEIREGRPKKFYVLTREGKAVRKGLLAIWQSQKEILNSVLKGVRDGIKT